MPDLANISGIGVAALSIFLMWKLTAKSMRHMAQSFEGLQTAVRELIVFLRHGK